MKIENSVRGGSALAASREEIKDGQSHARRLVSDPAEDLADTGVSRDLRMQGHVPEFLFPLEAVLSVDDVDLREVLPVRRFDRIMQDAGVKTLW